MYAKRGFSIHCVKSFEGITKAFLVRGKATGQKLRISDFEKDLRNGGLFHLPSYLGKSDLLLI